MENKEKSNVLDDAGAIVPDFAADLEYALRLWERCGLEREVLYLCIIASEVTQGAWDLLRVHIGMALGEGVAKEKIRGAIHLMGVYAGFPKAVKGLSIAGEVFA